MLDQLYIKTSDFIISKRENIKRGLEYIRLIGDLFFDGMIIGTIFICMLAMVFKKEYAMSILLLFALIHALIIISPFMTERLKSWQK